MAKARIGARSGYENPESEDGPSADLYAAADMALCKKVHDVLNAHYFHPGWKIMASHKAGLVWISIPQLMGDRAAAVIKISELEYDAHFSAVMRYAGELLERFRIPRTIGFDEAAFSAALATNPLGYLGRWSGANGSLPT